MSSTRALFASIGASASLVAAAAVALLVAGTVFAFGGSGGSLRSASAESAFILDGSAGHAPGMSHGSQPVAVAPVLLRARPRPHPRPPARRERPARAEVTPAPVAPPQARVVVQPRFRNAPAVAGVPQPPIAAPATISTGDGVRRVGAGISSTVKSTGTTLAAATAPLGPPVSQAVQDVLDRLAIALKRTTDALAGPLDKVLAPKR
jgi:hypothetical protein